MKRYSPFILILVAIALFFVVIDPQYKEIQALQEEKEANDSMLSLSKDLQDKRDRLHTAFNNISANEKDQLRKLLPDTVDNVRLILDINNIAETYGITIRNILVQGGENVDQESNGDVVQSDLSNEIGTISLSFSVTTTYEVFVEFLRDLEEALRIVDITRLNVEAGDGGFMNYSITLDTYWLR
jgi:Tfp pilus assembly protein PilO